MNEHTEVQVPGFIVNLIGRLVAENEALRAGLIPVNQGMDGGSDDADTADL